MKTVLLVSGGIDSTIMLMEAVARGTDCEVLYVRCGECYEDAEERHLRWFFKKYKIPYPLTVFDISTGKSKYNRFVPNRNLTIASIAVTSLDADIVYLAGVKDDNVVDKNPQAYAIMSNVLSTFSQRIVTVDSPFSDITKGELVERFIKNANIENAVQILQDTYSCYEGKEKECGACPACFRKYVALESNNISSGIDLQKSIVQEYLPKLHTYDADRISRTLIALRKLYGQILCFDLDGTLCEINNCFLYKEKKPIQENIQKVNKAQGLRVIYTSRLNSDREATLQWLQKNEVQYDVLLTNKAPFDVLFDDNARII